MVRWITLVLALAGLSIAIMAVTPTFPEPADLPADRPPSVNPFERGISALGQVETALREVNIAAPQAGLVMEVFVEVGAKVEAGEALLRLDDRTIRADLKRAEAAIVAAEAAILRWGALPRKEDLPPLEAAVKVAEAVLADRKDRAERLASAVKDAGLGAVAQREVESARQEAMRAEAELVKAQTELDRAKAGGWQPDLVVAQGELGKMQAEKGALELLAERLVVRAPRAGTVLRRDIEPGEYAETGKTPLVLGDLSHLNIRAQIDEEDIALVKMGAKARARTRGAVAEAFEVELLRIEPFARAKTNLSGSNTERVDTRVVEVVLRVVRLPGAAIYPGEAVDVYIDSN